MQQWVNVCLKMEKVIHSIALFLVLLGVGLTIYNNGFEKWQLFMLPIIVFSAYKILKKEDPQ